VERQLLWLRRSSELKRHADTNIHLRAGAVWFSQNQPGSEQNHGDTGLWMQGFIQFITGVYLLVGLTWFNVFGK
jgi:hypothetical protein